MAGRVLAQLLIAGGTFMVRTFAQAYRQAIVNAQAGGGASASAAQRATLRGQMTVDEAAKILGVDKSNMQIAQLRRKYQKLYDQNSVERGGSPFLQYKIIGAKEVLERECISRGQKPPENGSTQENGKIDGK